MNENDVVTESTFFSFCTMEDGGQSETPHKVQRSFSNLQGS